MLNQYEVDEFMNDVIAAESSSVERLFSFLRKVTTIEIIGLESSLRHVIGVNNVNSKW